MSRFNVYTYLVFLVSLMACQDGERLSDAYGTIETDEVMVAAQASGVLEKFDIQEGMILKEGQSVGLIDTLSLHIQKMELQAQREALRAQSGQLYAQIGIYESQKKNLLREQKRIEKLLEVDAATSKQKDDIEGQILVVENQIKHVESNKPALFAQIRALDAKEQLLDDQLRKSHILNAREGTVLTKYVEEKELVNFGKPLYKLGDLENVYAWAYISGKQLHEITIGQKVNVLYDLDGGDMGQQIGEVTFISSKSEFTPKTIQTKDERVDLVYAIKVRLKNDGLFKIGMPVEIRF
ncbi:HlyD family secretion protein [Persicobacter diffluens]|uniref:Membrane protein n=1 Tax=Persicobacter diffluens TaxID=981 RepID=A0AAN4VZ25_9BACT|nr:membrane protein [Persicobacter diffluens]